MKMHMKAEGIQGARVSTRCPWRNVKQQHTEDSVGAFAVTSTAEVN